MEKSRNSHQSRHSAFQNTPPFLAVEVGSLIWASLSLFWRLTTCWFDCLVETTKDLLPLVFFFRSCTVSRNLLSGVPFRIWFQKRIWFWYLVFVRFWKETRKVKSIGENWKQISLLFFFLFFFPSRFSPFRRGSGFGNLMEPATTVQIENVSFSSQKKQTGNVQ